MKRTLLFSLSVAFIGLCSYSSGPTTNGYNRTGAANTSANCTGGGCHAANNALTIVSIVVSDNSGNPVTKFSPDSTYTVGIIGGVASGSFPKFGFQLAAVNASATSTQAGTFTVLTPGTAKRSVSATPNLQIIEHTAPIAGAASGGAWVYTAGATWKAPSASAGINSVKFFVTLNAVNGNGSESGDQPNATSVTLANALGVNDISTLASLKTFPNPATNMFHVIADAANGVYNMQVINLAGQQMIAKDINISNGKFAETINVDGWVTGLYFVSITDNAGNVKRLPVTKL